MLNKWISAWEETYMNIMDIKNTSYLHVYHLISFLQQVNLIFLIQIL